MSNPITNTVKAVKKAKNGVKAKHSRVHYTTRFTRPATKKAVVTPKKTVPLHHNARVDPYSIIKLPLNTEAALREIENNVLTFLCDLKATKPQIKAAIAHRFNVKVAKVNTLIRPDCQKKAFVKLDASCDASEVASKLGLL
ncbi:ribosomal protein L23 [Gregarina niphandrodes]|uniref:Ribosomal protein L23 n=1 Tax=Gregarina niphandrodes TaxID=110365 RepID=A0A023B289_GRENI|nr:ribosomal protein L23 [Gregarina niphandrodes]EZG51716.1 ribosomal protein L23 [Gregarina niphandrodes]|eukprot:XP_011131929.1 ribosomal protein L23 [Gregarina niphandrodes]